MDRFGIGVPPGWSLLIWSMKCWSRRRRSSRGCELLDGTRGRADWSPLVNRTGGPELFRTTPRADGTGWNGMARPISTSDGTPP